MSSLSGSSFDSYRDVFRFTLRDRQARLSETSAVFIFRLYETLDVRRAHAAIFLAPAEVVVFCDSFLLHRFFRCYALPTKYFHFSEDYDDLFHRIVFSCHNFPILSKSVYQLITNFESRATFGGQVKYGMHHDCDRWKRKDDIIDSILPNHLLRFSCGKECKSEDRLMLVCG